MDEDRLGYEKGFAGLGDDLETRRSKSYDHVDVFGREDGNAIKYKTLSWEKVALLMIAEIVSNGMLSLPAACATIGVVPGVIVIAFLGIFATYTSVILANFKLRHPQVHSMGDAGYILFGPIGRELLAFGTFAFAVFATGSQLVAGYAALASLSDSKLCSLAYTGIFAAATLVLSFVRTFDKLSWWSLLSVICIVVAGIIGIAGAGLYPVSGGNIDIAVSGTFTDAFSAVTNPVFAYAGHYMFFVLISEMRHPEHAKRAAYTLQAFSTCFYILFAVTTYYWLGREVESPSFTSISNAKWQKAAFGIALPNFLVAGALYAHTASKLYFVRIFRNSHHLHEHTVLGWGVWTVFIVVCNGVAFVLAVGVPVFSLVVGLAGSLFAAWFTYGIAGFFWLHDNWLTFGYGLGRAWWQLWWDKRRNVKSLLAYFTIAAGAFICIAGLYVTIYGIVQEYNSGQISKPFSCEAPGG